MITPALFILCIVATIVLAVVLFFVTRAFEKANAELQRQMRANTSLQQNMQAKTQKALERVHEQTEGIISQATKKAVTILDEAKVFQTNDRSLVLTKLQELADVHEKAFGDISSTVEDQYQTALKTETNKAVKLFQDASNNIEGVLNQQITSFTENLEKQTIGQEKLVEEKVNKAYDAAEKEIAGYKEQQEKEVQKQITEQLHTIIFSVLGNSLTSEQQEALLLVQ